MMKFYTVFSWFLLGSLVQPALAAGPTVTLDSGIFTGLVSGPVIQFLGIPFAQPP